MSAPNDLVELMLSLKYPAFVKTEGYVPAVYTPGSELANEARMRDWLYGEAMLNNGNPLAPEFQRGEKPVSIFVGDMQHAWIRHYHVRKVFQGPHGWSYEWTLVR